MYITIFIENKEEILMVITVLISVTGDVVTCNMLSHSVVSDSLQSHGCRESLSL